MLKGSGVTRGLKGPSRREWISSVGSMEEGGVSVGFGEDVNRVASPSGIGDWVSKGSLNGDCVSLMRVGLRGRSDSEWKGGRRSFSSCGRGGRGSGGRSDRECGRLCSCTLCGIRVGRVLTGLFGNGGECGMRRSPLCGLGGRLGTDWETGMRPWPLCGLAG